MAKLKVSLILTVLNEESSILQLLSSIKNQSLPPDEVIIVDGGSTDGTIKKIQNSIPRLRSGQEFKIQNLRIFIKKGLNRAEGRNLAIKKAKNRIIAITDAGCELDKDWLFEIAKPFFSNNKIDVVAGYYQGKPQNVFEKCVVPYVLVMPDRVNPETFLPSARSMAIKKSVWRKTGGFPEECVDNEDYVFANILKKDGYKIFFANKAIVYWYPRKNIKEFWTMVYRFARGDAKAGLRRFRVMTMFLRYGFLILLLFFSLIFPSFFNIFLLIMFFYLGWSIGKNINYVKDLRAVYLLPLLQIISDLAVISGSIEGGLKSG